MSDKEQEKSFYQYRQAPGDGERGTRKGTIFVNDIVCADLCGDPNIGLMRHGFFVIDRFLGPENQIRCVHPQAPVRGTEQKTDEWAKRDGVPLRVDTACPCINATVVLQEMPPEQLDELRNDYDEVGKLYKVPC